MLGNINALLPMKEAELLVAKFVWMLLVSNEQSTCL